MAQIADRILDVCRRQPRRLAAQDEREALRYAALARRADAVAARLARLGLRHREPVVVPVSNAAADIAAFLGIWMAGGVAVPVHRSAPIGVAGAVVERLGARFATGARAVPAAWLPGEGFPVAVVGNTAPPERPLLSEAGTIVFTSGSTGRPKGVVLSAERASAKLDMIQSGVAMEAGARTLLVLQLTFSFGQWLAWLTLLRGGTLVMRERFIPGEAAALVAQGRIDRIGAVPTMLRRLIPALPEAARAWSGSILSGGEPLPAALGRQVRTALPVARLGDIYGLTETGTSDLFVPPEEYDGLAGTIGRPGPGIAHRVSGEGELLIRSPWGMLGYLDAPAATARAFEGGYFKTGDLVATRPDGALELIGRATDMVNRAGNKVAPLEVEAVFLAHPDVAAALAAGVPDPARGEALHLAVVARRGADIDPAGLAGWAAERLERYKLPDRIHVVDDLPAGGTGKADRGALKTMVEGGSAAGEPPPPGSTARP